MVKVYKLYQVVEFGSASVDGEIGHLFHLYAVYLDMLDLVVVSEAEHVRACDGVRLP